MSSDCSTSDIDSPLDNSAMDTVTSMSYQTRRRTVRKFITFMENLGSVNDRAIILSEALNDSCMEPVLSAAGIIKPKQFHSHQLLMKQVWKQLDRSSVKSSLRGRVNDDLQSYRTNALALLMPSPNSVSEEKLRNSDIWRMICDNTSIPARTARRILYNAKKQRIKLTKAEKDTTWSLLKYRNKYSTQQSVLNSSLLDWIVSHPHVISSPVAKDTIIVKVPNSQGELTKERVGKLFLEISVRDLHF